MKNIISILTIAILLLLSGNTFSQISILSGPGKGSYNQFVDDLVKVLGEKNGIEIINKATGGSAYNFNSITDPNSSFKIALIQSDYLNMMEAEDRLNNTKKTASLKVVMQLATEEIHLIAKKSSGLKNLQDLTMKNVGIGNEDQGSFTTGNIMKDRSKIAWYPYQVGFDEMLKALTDGRIDAGLIVGSAPVDLLNISPQVMSDGITLLELGDFNGWARYYENDTIYRGYYEWLDYDVPTFAVRTLLVVNESKLTSNEKQTVAAIKAGIIENLDYLKKQGHPQWKSVLTPDDPDYNVQPKVAPVKTSEPKPTSIEKDVITYRVQIYSRNYLREGEQVTVNGTTFNTYVYSYLDAYRYTIGEFDSVSAAVELQKQSRESGYKQAFVAAFKNNVRCTDPELLK